MINNIWFYDRYGTPEIILLFNKMIFIDRFGKNIGFINNNNAIYNYAGRHCGWLENGVMRDLNGYCAGFMQGANDIPSPIFPIPQIPPIPPIPQIPQIPPIPPIPQIPTIKSLKSFGWSILSPLTLFQNGR